MYFHHAVIKIHNEWLYQPQEGFIPSEVGTAALLSYTPFCTVYNSNSIESLLCKSTDVYHYVYKSG